MKKTLILLSVFVFQFAMINSLQAQHGGHNCGNCPHHKQHQQAAATCQEQQSKTVDGLAAEIVSAFPTAKEVKKESKWTVVYDSKKNVLGYAVYSKPASDGIKGYAGETPLMIALNPKQEIITVVMLDNQETPGFLQKVVNAGLLKSWDGMKPAKACKKKVDTVSGATYSSRSIIETLKAALKGV